MSRGAGAILGLIDDFDRNRFTILRSITPLGQLSLPPGLVDDGHHAVPYAKLAALVEQLGDVVGGGHRALVFSQFTGLLAKVRERLTALFSGVMDEGESAPQRGLSSDHSS